MCGIVGARHEWLLQNGLDPAAAMHAAVARLRWRGPDGAGVVRIGDWWLGCARLAITQRGSRQPVAQRGGRFAGVLNGAITNARELWTRLLPGAERRPAPPNDAWLPLLAVARSERHVLTTLRGHHAYAVVDAATGELVFGQDRFGEKPLFLLADRPDGAGVLHAFGSSPAALEALGMPGLPLPPDGPLGDLVRFGFCDPLPHRCGDHLWLTTVPARGAPWVVAPPTRGGRDAGWRPATAAAAAIAAPPTLPPTLRERLFAAVARCVDTTQPAGLLLSGGIDSSCIAAALRNAGRAAPAFQFLATGGDPRERHVAREVAAHCGLPFHPVDGGPEVLDALPHLTACAGLPLGDPSVLAVHAVARAAAATGVRILLGGEGADELFLGYRRYRALATMPHLPWLRRLVPQWSMRYAARWVRAATVADPGRALLEVTPPAFRDAVLAAPPPPAPATRRPREDLVLAARAQDLDGYLRLDLLPKVDIATMAAGIESRCPWLEGDCGEFGAGRAALGKAPLRREFSNLLPERVFRLPKRGFSLPLDRWFRTGNALLDLLAEPRTRQRQHLRPGGLASAVDRHRREGANLGHGLYLIAAVELFLRRSER